MTVERISIAAILSDESTQARARTDNATADEYAESMRAGATFPPVVLFRDEGGALRIGDGWHRVSAARKAGLAEIEAEVRRGDARDALLFGIEANAKHGLKFTNADKNRVVNLMLDDAEMMGLSDREIARRCRVSQPFVSKLRAARTDNGYQSDREDGAGENGLTLAAAEAMFERGCAAEIQGIIRTGNGLAGIQQDWPSLCDGETSFADYVRDQFGFDPGLTEELITAAREPDALGPAAFSCLGWKTRQASQRRERRDARAENGYGWDADARLEEADAEHGARVARVEADVSAGGDELSAAGECLRLIRDAESYRGAGHLTFADFVQDRLGMEPGLATWMIEPALFEPGGRDYGGFVDMMLGECREWLSRNTTRPSGGAAMQVQAPAA